MSAIPQVRKTGPKSYPAGSPVTGGQLVEAHGTNVQPAPAAGLLRL